MTRAMCAAIFVCALALSTVAANAKPRHQIAPADSAALAYCAADQTYRTTCGQPENRTTSRARVKAAAYTAISYSSLVERARAEMGKTAAQLGLRRTLWCSAFLRMLTGRDDVDDRAISWLKRPHETPSVGSVAVMRHHVGVVSGFDANGNPILISGNHNNRVNEGAYPRHRVLAYVSP